jgi:hypothetical protein
LRSGSVPAVSPPALHFSARRTADRSRKQIRNYSKRYARFNHPSVASISHNQPHL